jgi:hypothetical protein
MKHSPARPFPRITPSSPPVRSAIDRQTPAGRGQTPSRPACVRIRGVRCLWRECGDYVSVAHIVRGEREAFCGHCRPVCNPRLRLVGQAGNDAA